MTKAQEQVLASLRAQGFSAHTFSAQDAFPGTTPQDNAHRRVLESLVREGILAHGPAPQGRALSPVATEAVADMQRGRDTLLNASYRVDQAIGPEARQVLERWLQARGINPQALYNVQQAREIAGDALEARVISPGVHKHYTTHILGGRQSADQDFLVEFLARVQSKASFYEEKYTDRGPARPPASEKTLYHFTPQMEKAVSRQRETSVGHRAEQKRGQEMGL